MNVLPKLTAIVLAAALLILWPSFSASWIVDHAVLKQVNEITNTFANNVKEKGFISKEMYEHFVQKLAYTRYVYDIEIVHTRKVYYPLQPGDPGYDPIDRTFIIYDEKYPTQQIIDTLYTQNKDYRMKFGDEISVKVRNKSRTALQIFTMWMGGIGNANLIFSSAGGLITNEDY